VSGYTTETDCMRLCGRTATTTGSGHFGSTTAAVILLGATPSTVPSVGGSAPSMWIASPDGAAQTDTLLGGWLRLPGTELGLSGCRSGSVNGTYSLRTVAEARSCTRSELTDYLGLVKGRGHISW